MTKTKINDRPTTRPQIIKAAYLLPHSRDYQRRRVYDWEGEVLPRRAKFLSLAECQNYIEAIFRRQGLIHPVVKDRREGCVACFCARDYSIRLPAWSRTLPVVLHEAAHGLLHFGPDLMRFEAIAVRRGIAPYLRHAERHDRRAAWSAHGPIFVAIYIGLLTEYGLGRAHGLRDWAIDCGVDVAPFAGTGAKR